MSQVDSLQTDALKSAAADLGRQSDDARLSGDLVRACDLAEAAQRTRKSIQDLQRRK